MSSSGILRRVDVIRTGVSAECRFLGEPHGVTSQNTPFLKELCWFPQRYRMHEVYEWVVKCLVIIIIIIIISPSTTTMTRPVLAPVWPLHTCYQPYGVLSTFSFKLFYIQVRACQAPPGWDLPNLFSKPELFRGCRVLPRLFSYTRTQGGVTCNQS
jgi:hypothetical protein